MIVRMYFFLAIFSCVSFSKTTAQEIQKTVAVLEFQSSGELTKSQVTTLTNRFRGILVDTRAFKVVEREKMTEVLAEQDFTLTDACNTSECAVQVGQLLGVQQMIGGDIGKLGQTFTVDLRLIDVSTGGILETKKRNYKGEIDGLLDVMQEIAQEFASANLQGSRNLVGSKPKVSSKKWWYIAGGAAVVGGLVAILLRGSSSSNVAAEGIVSADLPADP